MLIQRLTPGIVGRYDCAFCTKLLTLELGLLPVLFLAGFAGLVPLAVATRPFFFGLSSLVVRAPPRAWVLLRFDVALFFATVDLVLDVFFLLAPRGAIDFLSGADCFVLRPRASDTMKDCMWKRRRRRATHVSALVLGVVVASVASVDAREVSFPIKLDERFLTSELVRNVYTDSGNTARVFDDGSGCNSLVLFDPTVLAEDGVLRVRTAAEARIGVAAGERCLLPISWNGLVELIEEPRLHPRAPIVRFVVVDSRLLDRDGEPATVSSTVWSWVKDHVQPRLETRIDLQRPVDELRALLPAFGVSARGDTVDRALASLSLAGVAVRPGTVEVRVRIEVPEPPRPTQVALAPDASPAPATPTPAAAPASPADEAPADESPAEESSTDEATADAASASPEDVSPETAAPDAGATPDAVAQAPDASPPPEPEPPLTPEELLRWQTALQQWDAFLTFVIKVTGRDAKAVELRKTLLEILLDERYALLDALANPEPAQQDPVRPMFLRTWTRLAPVLRQVSDRLPADEALRYLAFVSAGDALQALDQLGPDYGIEISADGLRRFARLVAPTTIEDPLTYGMEVDPQLRELFGFGPPIAPPEENPEVEPTSWWFGFGSTAWAAEPPDRELLRRLNSWAPTRKDIEEYVPLAYRLLQSVTDGLIEKHHVPTEHEEVFRALVPATAWKESCWRQFVKRNGKLVPLTSPVGSIGIMQVNVSVWRGFYDVQGLRRDIGYNARAGGEILTRYFLDYAVARGEDRKGGGPDALARATYAAYNGGPSQLTRYRQKGRSQRERRVDREFFAQYQRMKTGDVRGVVECFTE